ncbi:MAG: protein kinase [Vicinamibacterales bacterium]
MHIGQYEIVRMLGRGGMGSVYVARDPAIDRLVAIKLLREGVDSPEVRERFKREARSAGQLRHPNIVTIFHVGDHESSPYIVMEYIPGETLAELISQQAPLTIGRKLRIIEEVCRGLAYAHKFGIVHRDVKPLNILVDTEGSVKILDFGVARAGDQGLTQLGMMMGTPNYMSPEQISPGRADHRSDVFAVGLVFYELLTYRRAFPGHDFSVLQRILQSDPDPVERYCPGIDPAILAVLRRALAKKPDERYQDLGAMRQDILDIWTRLKTPEDESFGVLSPSTPADTPYYDGPTLVPGPNEEVAPTIDSTRAMELARELARVADEKRRAEEAADTPSLGTTRPDDPTRALTPAELATLEEARAEQRRKSSRAPSQTRPAAPPDAPRADTPASRLTTPPAPVAISPSTADAVAATSPSDPTVVVRRAPEVRVPTSPAPAGSAAGTASHSDTSPAAAHRTAPGWLLPAAAAATIAVALALWLWPDSGAGTGPATQPADSSTTAGVPASSTGAAALPGAEGSAAFRSRIAALLGRGDIAGAVDELRGRTSNNDPDIVAVAMAVVEAGRSDAAVALEQARTAGAAASAPGTYNKALARQAAAGTAATGGHPAEAAVAYLEAASLFRQAAVEGAKAPASGPSATSTAGAAGAPGAPGPSRAVDTSAIETLLAQYAEAYNRMDAGAVRTVWPGAPAGLSFAGNRSYSLTLVGPDLRFVQPDRAVVSAQRHTVQELENGQKRETSVDVTMNLRRISGGWVIDTVQ